MLSLRRSLRTCKTNHGKCFGSFVLSLIIIVAVVVLSFATAILRPVFRHRLFVLLPQALRFLLVRGFSGSGQRLPALAAKLGNLCDVRTANILLQRCAVVAQPQPIGSRWLLRLVRVLLPLGPLALLFLLRSGLLRSSLAHDASVLLELLEGPLVLGLELCCLLFIRLLLGVAHGLPLLTRQLADDWCFAAACFLGECFPVFGEEEPVRVLWLLRLLARHGL